jgi:DNA-binding SARP family transcriptional activator
MLGQLHRSFKHDRDCVGRGNLMSSLPIRKRAPGPATADLRIYLLGPPSIAWQGASSTLTRRQARALLFYLAATPQPVTRAPLCLLLWPGVTESTAHCNLRRLVSILNGALPVPNLLITADDRIGLAHQNIWSDPQALQELWAAWTAGSQPSYLQHAVALDRGAFLDGFSLPDSPEYEAWITTERQRWARMALQALAAWVDDQASEFCDRAALAGRMCMGSRATT